MQRRQVPSGKMQPNSVTHFQEQDGQDAHSYYYKMDDSATNLLFLQNSD